MGPSGKARGTEASSAEASAVLALELLPPTQTPSLPCTHSYTP